MAQNGMVKEMLTESQIKVGREIIKKLDKKGWPVRASLWIYVPDLHQWKFIIASPRVKSDGPRQSYQAVQGYLSEIPEAKDVIPLSEIGLTSPDDSLISLLASAIQTGPELAGIRFTGNVINGQVIEDAYIYRLSEKAPTGEKT